MKYNYYERHTNEFLCNSTDNSEEFIKSISFKYNVPVKNIIMFTENPDLPNINNDDVMSTEV